MAQRPLFDAQSDSSEITGQGMERCCPWAKGKTEHIADVDLTRKEPIRGYDLSLHACLALQYPSFIALALFSIQSIYIASQGDQNAFSLLSKNFMNLTECDYNAPLLNFLMEGGSFISAFCGEEKYITRPLLRQ